MKEFALTQDFAVSDRAKELPGEPFSA